MLNKRKINFVVVRCLCEVFRV